MIIYEVNLNIEKEIYPEFALWLRDHVNEMLQFPGFIQASILKEKNSEITDQGKLTVQYQIENRNFLEGYFTEFAPRMREEGLKRFRDKFSATRRIFEVQGILSK